MTLVEWVITIVATMALILTFNAITTSLSKRIVELRGWCQQLEERVNRLESASPRGKTRTMWGD